MYTGGLRIINPSPTFLLCSLTLKNWKGSEEEEETVPTLESVRQMREICRVFKTIVLEVHGDVRRYNTLMALLL